MSKHLIKEMIKYDYDGIIFHDTFKHPNDIDFKSFGEYIRKKIIERCPILKSSYTFYKIINGEKVFNKK